MEVTPRNETEASATAMTGQKVDGDCGGPAETIVSSSSSGDAGAQDASLSPPGAAGHATDDLDDGQAVKANAGTEDCSQATIPTTGMEGPVAASGERSDTEVEGSRAVAVAVAVAVAADDPSHEHEDDDGKDDRHDATECEYIPLDGAEVTGKGAAVGHAATKPDDDCVDDGAKTNQAEVGNSSEPDVARNEVERTVQVIDADAKSDEACANETVESSKVQIGETQPIQVPRDDVERKRDDEDMGIVQARDGAVADQDRKSTKEVKLLNQGEEKTDEASARDGDGKLLDTSGGTHEETKDETDRDSAVSDEDYFATLTQEELDWYKELGPSPESLRDKVISCTTCYCRITNTGSNFAVRHPCLGIITCKACNAFYTDGEWTKDEEGMDEFCRWCAQGGDLLLCDECTSAFCKRCIRHNLGRKTLSSVTSAEQWKCLLCDPKPIYKYRANYHALSLLLRNRGSQSNAKQEPLRRRVGPEDESAKSDAHATTFVDETINSAFQALESYQRALEDERKRWLRNNLMEVQGVAAACRNLRKVFATTKLTMELLDTAIVDAFKASFPKANTAKLIPLARGTVQSAMVPESLELVRKRTASTSAGESSPSKRGKRNVRKSVSKDKQTRIRVKDSVEKARTKKNAKRKTRPSMTSSSSKTKRPVANKVSNNLFRKKKVDVLGTKKRPIILDASDDSEESDLELSNQMVNLVPSIMKKPGPKSKTMFRR